MKISIKKMMFSVLIFTLFFQLSFAQNIFPDTSNHWGEEYVTWVSEKMNLLQGFEDGTFRPDEMITRGEFVVVLNSLLYSMDRYQDIDYTGDLEGLPYQDIKQNSILYNHLQDFKGYISQKGYTNIKLENIFKGNQFKVNDPITRYEATLLIRAITTPPIENIQHSYADFSVDLPFYVEIMEVINNGIIRGYNDGTIRLTRGVTRAEAATLLHRVHKDLLYLDENYLDIKPINSDNNEGKLPFFQLTGDEKQDQRFIDAIISLDYISFVGYIPYNEIHLYDTEPLKTLWELKNGDYNNLLGINHYLIRYDEEMDFETKTQLVKEGLLYLQEEAKLEDIFEINGLYQFLKLAKKYVNEDEIMEMAKAYYQSATNETHKVKAGFFITNEYLMLNEREDAIKLYKEMIPMEMELDSKKQLIMNYGYLIVEERGTNAAIDELLSMKRALEKIENNPEGEALRKLYTGMIKQLMMEE